MKCLVCGVRFDRDDLCPHCGFPVTFYPVYNEETEQAELASAARYRKKLMDGMEIQVPGFEYSVSGDKIELVRQWTDPMGTAGAMLEQPVWLKRKLTAPATGTLRAQVVCTRKGERRQLSGELKADTQSPEVEFGLQVDENFGLHMLLRDGGAILSEQTVPLLPD